MLLTLLLLTSLFARNNVICSTTIWSGERETERDFITGFPTNLNCGNIAGALIFQNKCVCKYPKMFHIKDRNYECYDVNSVCQVSDAECLELYAIKYMTKNNKTYLMFLHSKNGHINSGILNCNIQMYCRNIQNYRRIIKLRANFDKWTSSGWNKSLKRNVGLNAFVHNTGYTLFQINPNVLSESSLLKMSVWRNNDDEPITHYVIRIKGNFKYHALATTTTPTTTTAPTPPPPITTTTTKEWLIKTTSYINGKKDEKTYKTTIMYIVIPIVALLIFILCFALIRKRKAHKTGKNDSEEKGKPVKSDQVEQSERMADKSVEGEKTIDASETYASVTNLNKLQIKTNDKTHEKSAQRDIDNCLKDVIVPLTVYEPFCHDINDEYAVIDKANRSEKVYLQETNVYYEAGCKLRSCDAAEQQPLHQNPEEEPIYFETVGDEYGVVEKPRKGNENNSKESTEFTRKSKSTQWSKKTDA